MKSFILLLILQLKSLFAIEIQNDQQYNINKSEEPSNLINYLDNVDDLILDEYIKPSSEYSSHDYNLPELDPDFVKQWLDYSLTDNIKSSFNNEELKPENEESKISLESKPLDQNTNETTNQLVQTTSNSKETDNPIEKSKDTVNKPQRKRKASTNICTTPSKKLNLTYYMAIIEEVKQFDRDLKSEMKTNKGMGKDNFIDHIYNLHFINEVDFKYILKRMISIYLYPRMDIKYDIPAHTSSETPDSIMIKHKEFFDRIKKYRSYERYLSLKTNSIYKDFITTLEIGTEILSLDISREIIDKTIKNNRNLESYELSLYNCNLLIKDPVFLDFTKSIIENILTPDEKNIDESNDIVTAMLFTLIKSYIALFEDNIIPHLSMCMKNQDKNRYVIQQVNKISLSNFIDKLKNMIIKKNITDLEIIYRINLRFMGVYEIFNIYFIFEELLLRLWQKNNSNLTIKNIFKSASREIKYSFNIILLDRSLNSKEMNKDLSTKH